MPKESAVMGIAVKSITGLASYATGNQMAKDQSRRKAQLKRQRTYEKTYRKRHYR